MQSQLLFKINVSHAFELTKRSYSPERLTTPERKRHVDEDSLGVPLDSVGLPAPIVLQSVTRTTVCLETVKGSSWVRSEVGVRSFGQTHT